jgi:hypothetical protein
MAGFFAAICHPEGVFATEGSHFLLKMRSLGFASGWQEDIFSLS